MNIFKYIENDVVNDGIIKDGRYYKVDNIFNQNPNIIKELENENVELDWIIKPSKLIAVGLNYKAHAEEMNVDLPDKPTVFFKAISSLCSDESHIMLPNYEDKIDFEGEIVIVIKDDVKNVDENEAHKYILGVTAGNDVSNRTLQFSTSQWGLAKSFDTFAPVSKILNRYEKGMKINLESYHNGNLKQKANNEEMIFNVEYIVSYLSKIMQLKKGDMIFTGCPKGVEKLNKGDTVDIIVNNIKLSNTVS